MTTSRLCISICCLLALSGCQVIEKAKECGVLASTLKSASGKLSTPKISNNPAPRLLNEKGKHYAELAESIGKLSFTDPGLKNEVNTLQSLLIQVGTYLTDAAKSVERAEAINKSIEQRVAATSPEQPTAPAFKSREPTYLQVRRYTYLKKSIDNASKSVDANVIRLQTICR